MTSVLLLLSCFKIIIASAIFFVWVVRYDNIIKEFKEFGLPDWLRDLVGILKLSFAFMLTNDSYLVVCVGAMGIAALMIAALVTHIRISNPFSKMVPALTLLVLSLLICSQWLV